MSFPKSVIRALRKGANAKNGVCRSRLYPGKGATVGIDCVLEDRYPRAAAGLREGLEQTLPFINRESPNCCGIDSEPRISSRASIADLHTSPAESSDGATLISATDGLPRRALILRDNPSTQFQRIGSGRRCSEHSSGISEPNFNLQAESHSSP